MPSKYVRVPRKKPDKLGFDEVSDEASLEVESAGNGTWTPGV